MTDSSAVPATTDRITELLGKHNIRGSRPLSMSGVVFAQECPCGFQWEVYAEWAEHLAAALAVLVADAQTDAWDEGYGEGIIHMGMSIEEHGKQPGNPYRSGGSDTEQQQQQINAPEGEEHAGSDKVIGTHTPHTTPTGDETP